MLTYTQTTKLVGILVLLDVLIIALYLHSQGAKPGAKPLPLAILCFALIIGGGLLLYDRITELTVPMFGTLKAATERAVADANAISEVRQQVEAAGKSAQKAVKQVEELGSKIELAGAQLEKIKKTVEGAQNALKQVETDAEFSRVNLAAQNDSRPAFDQLKKWSKDPSNSYAEAAAGAVAAIVARHPRNFFWNNHWELSGKQDGSQDELSEHSKGSPRDREAVMWHIIIRRDLDGEKVFNFIINAAQADPSIRVSASAATILLDQIGNVAPEPRTAVMPLETETVLDLWRTHGDAVLTGRKRR